MPLGELTPQLIEDWRASLPGGARTKNKQMTVLNGIMKRACRKYGLKRNPVSGVERLREVKKLDLEVLEPEEVWALVRDAFAVLDAIGWRRPEPPPESVDVPFTAGFVEQLRQRRYDLGHTNIDRLNRRDLETTRTNATGSTPKSRRIGTRLSYSTGASRGSPDARETRRSPFRPPEETLRQTLPGLCAVSWSHTRARCLLVC